MPSNPQDREPRSARHFAAYAGMCLIWGSTFLAIRIGNESLAPFWAAALRLVIAGALLFLLTALFRLPLPRGRALTAALLFGALHFGVNLGLLYWGETRVPSGLAAIFFATMPLSTGLLAAALGVQRLHAGRTALAVVGLAGVAVIFAGEVTFGAPPGPLLAVFVAATAASLAGVLFKRAPAQHPIPANAVAAVVGALLCVAGSAALGEPHGLPRTTAGWWPVVYLAVAGNLGAFVLFTWLVTQWAVTTVSTSALIIPVIAVVLGAVTKGEALSPPAYLGAILVLGSVAETLWIGHLGEIVHEARAGAPRVARILAPPPLLFGFVLAAGLWLHAWAPSPLPAPALLRALGVLALAAGGAIGLSGLGAFRRGRTSFLPHEPSTALVTDGPFRFTRNPLYVSLALFYLAASLWLDNLWMLLLVPPLVAAVDRLVVVREERYLEWIFGDAYRAYRARVRRWI